MKTISPKRRNKMNISKLQIAIAEAERFLIRAHDCMQEDDRIRAPRGFTSLCLLSPQSTTAAVKRASLDLSKALSNLRK